MITIIKRIRVTEVFFNTAVPNVSLSVNSRLMKISRATKSSQLIGNETFLNDNKINWTDKRSSLDF